MKKIVYLYIILFFNLNCLCQVHKGIVIDSLGNPIENAYIINENSKSHAHSDELGKFTIEKTNINDLLIISALGFEKKTYSVENLDIEIILKHTTYKLDEVVISSRLSALNVISKIDLSTAPVKSSQEILRKVPGLFIGQHAGGGKAEQIFLRGFDLDHGTDIALSVDGMPVNMVSHAHGQGYADLHFVIPETIEKIDFGKGSYYADKGDFATAGYVDFKTKETFENNLISAEVGQFNSFRYLGVFNLLDNKYKDKAFIATEYMLTDGPFESPQNFKRINLFGKYTSSLTDNTKITYTASHFTSRWDASGQIPQRLVDNGSISRFGAVDNTEGGVTERTNFNVALFKPVSDNLYLKANTFYSKYEFLLYSNFTFFLNDPMNGDQIRQKESRSIYGVNTELTKKFDKGFNRIGFGFRTDETQDTELSHTLNRNTTLENIKLGNINQSNIFFYLNSEYELGKLKINPIIRLDYFKFNYQDHLNTQYSSNSQNKTILSPKLNFIYSPTSNLQIFLKSGFGFHSNDTRVVVSQKGKEVLPSSFGSDFGIVYKPFPKLLLNSALWILTMQQEFVYVGDEAIVEPKGSSLRKGIDFGVRFQWSDYLFFDLDTNYTYARSIDEANGKNYIPLAPSFTTTAGISLQKYKNFSGGIQYRYLRSRPANEDNSIVANGYAIVDMNINYSFKKIVLGMSAENLLNTKWNETQFATESRLKNESQSVEEIHFTPGTPFYLKAKIIYKF